MSPHALSRPLARRSGAWSRIAARRFESTTTKAAESVKDAATNLSSAASEYTAKASQGLSKVSSSAGSATSGAATKVTNSLQRMTDRANKVVDLFKKQVPIVIYYSKVGLELSKFVIHGRQMSPPSLQSIRSYWHEAWHSLRNPNALLRTASESASKVTQQPETIIQRVRNLNRAQLAAGGVVVAECLGFFTIGEILGRRKLVGYHGEVGGVHH